MEKWDLAFGDVNLSLLYDLLREQFCNLDDPWYRDTLKWWNGWVQRAQGTPVTSHSRPTLAMYSPTQQTPKDHRTEGKQKGPQRESEWDRSGKREWLRVCPRLAATPVFDFLSPMHNC